MNFSESISSCFSKYATFKGRASRSEFWWFYLFSVMLQGGATIVGGVEALITNQTYLFDVFPIIASLVTMIPSLAVSCRRLHDIDKSGWWILIGLTIIGIIPLIIWWAREAKDEDNRFGVAPNCESSNKTKNEINTNKISLKTTTNKNNLEEKVKSKKIEVKNIQNSHNINTALLRERQKYKVRTFYLLGFIGFISISIYFFLLLSNGTKIIILPEEASINAKVKSENFFDLSFNNFVYSFNSKPVFSVSSKGYKKIRETITYENKGKFHEVLMTELPGILNVNINNKNENTQWFLDEKFIFQGEKLEISLPAGQYNLAVNNPFFEKKNTNVTIEKGEPNNLDLELNNINGFIKIDSEPANASVFINKKKIGQTPIIFKDQGGRYMIEVKKENYEKINETIIITNQNKVNQRNYILGLIEAKLKVTTKPKGGNLNINGLVYQPNKFINLKSNKEYVVSYEKPGFKKKSLNLNLKPNEERTEIINLEEEYGIVEIISQPEAEIWINGKLSGQTPKLVELRTIQQTIEVRKKKLQVCD